MYFLILICFVNIKWVNVINTESEGNTKEVGNQEIKWKETEKQ